MTADETMAMPAGREMDELVSVKLMGGFTVHGDNPWSGPPPYSTDIAAAWQVVEKMINKLVGFEILRWPSIDGQEDWNVLYGSGQVGRFAAQAPTAPLAICRAALMAAQEANL